MAKPSPEGDERLAEDACQAALLSGASDSTRTEGLAPGVGQVLLLLGQDQSTLVLGYILLSHDHECAFFWKQIVVE